jgi:hypothetical protein
MSTPRLSELEGRLLQAPEADRFSSAELDGLTAPMRRHLSQALTPGTPLATSAWPGRCGHVKVGRWLPFRARAGCPIDPHLAPLQAMPNQHPGLAVPVQPGRALVLRGGVSMGTAPPPYDFTWAFVLQPEGTTRLLVRERYATPSGGRRCWSSRLR